MEALEKRMIDLLRTYGEEWSKYYSDEFGLDNAVLLADFFNNGGLTLNNEHTREHCAVIYVALTEDSSVDIGCWVWKYGDDFDSEAEWIVLTPPYFYDWELEAINNRIIDIYGTR